MYRATQKLICGHNQNCAISLVRQNLYLNRRPEVVGHAAAVAQQQAAYSTDPNRRPGFFESLIDNIKKESDKSKELKDSLNKFREEAKKLEESEALKEARRKFQNIEGETQKLKGSNVLR